MYDGWIRLQYYTVVSLPKRHPIENVSFTSKALVGDNGSMLCSMVIRNLTCLKLFATSVCVKEIVAVTQMICYVEVHDTSKRFGVQHLALKRTYGYFTPSSVHFTGKKKC